MKKLFLIAFIFTYVSMNVSNAQDHDHNGHQMDESKDQPMKHDMHAQKIDPAFQEQLSMVYFASLGIKEVLAEDNSESVSKEAEKVFNAIQKVDMKLLMGDAHVNWMGYQNTFRHLIREISSTDNIVEQRKYFASFNETLYKSIKEFGINSYRVYYQYCPMALSNSGAYWLSDIKEIQNPYMGQTMPKCGSTKEVIN